MKDAVIFIIPKTKDEWWLAKINRNKQLDDNNLQTLT